MNKHHIVPPGATIGILGGGQLGRMLAMAAARLGYRTHIFTPEPDSPASEVVWKCTVADYSDADALQQFADSVDVITLEFENVPVDAIRSMAKLRPSPDVLEICQHRAREKEFIRGCGIGTAPFMQVRSQEDVKKAPPGFSVLKTCRFGYDGKGQWKINSPTDIPDLVTGQEYILEGFVDFFMEISVIAARSVTGEIACFPAVQNIHRNHILHQTIAPAPIAADIAAEAERLARTLAEALKLEGLLAVEMFVTKDGVLVNELAPRPHNSGHWTMDACATSQFEQGVRAVCGLPLGATDILCPSVMTNLIGDDVQGWERYLRDPRARLHLYGKRKARPGRKMGHVTVLAE